MRVDRIFYDNNEICLYIREIVKGTWLGEIEFTYKDYFYSYAAPAAKTLPECFELLQKFRAEALHITDNAN